LEPESFHFDGAGAETVTRCSFIPSSEGSSFDFAGTGSNSINLKFDMIRLKETIYEAGFKKQDKKLPIFYSLTFMTLKSEPHQCCHPRPFHTNRALIRSIRELFMQMSADDIAKEIRRVQALPVRFTVSIYLMVS
jgi:hypothetical protein